MSAWNSFIYIYLLFTHPYMHWKVIHSLLTLSIVNILLVTYQPYCVLSGFGRISRKNCEYFSKPIIYPAIQVVPIPRYSKILNYNFNNSWNILRVLILFTHVKLYLKFWHFLSKYVKKCQKNVKNNFTLFHFDIFFSNKLKKISMSKCQKKLHIT